MNFIKMFLMMISLQEQNVGMHEPLVDAQDYPRGDIDVPAVRAARQTIIRKLERKKKKKPKLSCRKFPPDNLLLDSAPNLGPLVSRCEINKF